MARPALHPFPEYSAFPITGQAISHPSQFSLGTFGSDHRRSRECSSPPGPCYCGHDQQDAQFEDPCHINFEHAVVAWGIFECTMGHGRSALDTHAGSSLRLRPALYVSEGFTTHQGMQISHFDKIITNASRVTDPGRRLCYMARLRSIRLRDVPTLYLTYPDRVAWVRPGIHGLLIRPSWAIDLTRLARDAWTCEEKTQRTSFTT